MGKVFKCYRLQKQNESLHREKKKAPEKRGKAKWKMYRP